MIPSDIMGNISMFSLDAHISTLKYRLETEEIKLMDVAYLWDIEAESKLIESFILGLPVPPVYVMKRKSNKYYEVVDGHHRINTIVNFYANELKLVLDNKDLNGKTYQTLDDEYKNILSIATLRIWGIREVDDDALVHEIFRRLNLGSTKRTSKEIKELLK